MSLFCSAQLQKTHQHPCSSINNSTLDKMLKSSFVGHLQASHEGNCDFMIILCPSCKELMRANEQERHNERECPERTLNCKYCKEPFLLKNIKVRFLCFIEVKNCSGIVPVYFQGYIVMYYDIVAWYLSTLVQTYRYWCYEKWMLINVCD